MASSEDHDDGAAAITCHRRTQIRQRRWLVAFSLAMTFCFVGATFGWGPMQLLLERNGAFHSKCSSSNGTDDDNDAVCSEQTAALLNVQVVSFVTLLLAPVFGHIADHYGAPVTATIMGGCFILGTLLLTLATAYGTDWLLYFACVCLAIGTWNGLILTVHTGLYFVGHTRSRVIFTMNAMKDAGGISYLGLWGVGEVAPDAKVSHILSGYLGLACVLVVGHLYFFHVSVPEEEKEDDDELVKTESPVELQETAPTTQHETENKDESKDEEGAVSANAHSSLVKTNFSGELGQSTSNNISNYEYGDTDHYVIVADRPSRNQILSRPYLWLALFFSIHATTSNFMLATTRDFLAYLGDDDYNNKYLNIFTLLLPASLIALPAVDCVILKFGFFGGFTMINLLALGYLLIRLFSDSLNVQIFGFVLFSF